MNNRPFAERFKKNIFPETREEEQRFDRLFIGLWWVFVFISFIPHFIRGRVPISPFWLLETPYQWLPYREYVAHMFREGLFPAWAPQISCGFPFTAFPQTGVFYPPLVLFWFLATPTFFTLEFIFGLGICGTFVYLSLRRVELSPLAAVAGTLALAGGAYLNHYLTYIITGRAFTWYAVTMWGALSLAKGPRRLKYFAVTALGFAICLLNGELQSLLYTMPFLLVVGFLNIGPGQRSARSLLILASLAAGTIAAAGALLPLVEFMPHSARAGGVTFNYYHYISHQAHTLALAFFPHYPVSGSRYASPIYLGCSVLVLGIAGLVSRGRGAWWLVLLILVSVLITMGVTPVLKVMYLLPGFKSFLVHFSAMHINYFLAAWLAGIGFTRIVENWPDKKRSIQVLIAVNLILVVESAVAQDLARAVLLLISFIILGYIYRRRLGKKTLAAALIFMIFADLTFTTIQKRASYKMSDFNLLPEAVEILKQQDMTRYWVISSLGYFDPLLHANMGLRLDPLLPGSSNPCSFWRVPLLKIGNLINLIAPGYLKFVDGKLDQVDQEAPVRASSITQASLPVLSMMNVGKILDRGLKPAEIRGLIPEPHGSITVYRNTSVLPRIHLVGKVVPAKNDEEALDIIARGKLDPASEAVVNSAALVNISLTGRAVSSRIKINYAAPGKWDVSLEPRAPATSFLVLSETLMPGWFAEIDGQSARIVPSNYAFMGLELPAGAGNVKFFYRPFSVRIALWTTLTALVTIISILLFGSGPRRTSHEKRLQGSAILPILI